MKNVAEGLGELKQQFVFYLRIVFNLRNSLMKVASQLFLKSFSPKYDYFWQCILVLLNT
jgi:hypothetical protein